MNYFNKIDKYVFLNDLATVLLNEVRGYRKT